MAKTSKTIWNKNKHKKGQNITFKRKLTTLFSKVSVISKWIILISLFCVLCTSYFTSVRTWSFNNLMTLTYELGFKLDEVVIQGVEQIKVQEVLELLPDSDTAIIAVDLHNLYEKLKEHKWVKNVLIKRMLPSIIHIVIQEKIPIAIWQFQGQLFLIDTDGDIIQESNIQDFSNLLHVIGLGANTHVNELIRDISKHQELSIHIKKAIRYGERRWNLYFDDDMIAKMPETNFAAAYDYLYKLNEDNKLFKGQYRIIDMRNNEKFYLIEQMNDPK